MDHISPAARNAFAQIVQRSVRTMVGHTPQDDVQVVPLTGQAARRPAEQSVLVFTISSFRFRMMVMFPLSEDPAVRAHYTTGDAASRFEDVFAEIGNLTCGAINRDLSLVFPHLGMSTPYTLPHQCIEFVDALNPEYQLQLTVTINGSMKLAVQVALCAYAPIDFTLPAVTDQTEVGELEMF
jgi:hypothetical protein